MKTASTSAAPSAPKAVSVGEAFAFAGPLPEKANGRLAMVRLAYAVQGWMWSWAAGGVWLRWKRWRHGVRHTEEMSSTCGNIVPEWGDFKPSKQNSPSAAHLPCVASVLSMPASLPTQLCGLHEYGVDLYGR